MLICLRSALFVAFVAGLVPHLKAAYIWNNTGSVINGATLHTWNGDCGVGAYAGGWNINNFQPGAVTQVPAGTYYRFDNPSSTAGTCMPNTPGVTNGVAGIQYTNWGIANLCWTNKSAHYAEVQLWFDPVSGDASQVGTTEIIPPGGYKCVSANTNNYGAGTFYLGDVRAQTPGITNSDGVVVMTGDFNTPPTSMANGSTVSGVQGGSVNNQSTAARNVAELTTPQSGNTNTGSVSQSDIRTLQQGLVTSLGELNAAVRMGPTNGGVQSVDNAALRQIATNTAPLVSTASLSFTNQLAGSGDAARASLSNSVVGMVEAVGQLETSAGEVATMFQEPPSGYGSITSLTAWVPGLHAAGLQIQGVDMVDVFNAAMLDAWIPGLRAWFRIVILWGLIVGMVVWAFYAIGEHVYTIAAVPQVQVNALVLGAASLVPGANVAPRLGIVAAVSLAILAIPVLVIGVLETALVLSGVLGAGSHVSGATVSSPFTSGPSAFLYAGYVINLWFPLVEGLIFAIMRAVGNMSVKAATSLAVVYVKAVGI